MTLLQRTADILIKSGIVKNYSDFSRIFCGKTENYFYRQKFYNRDFSLGGLIECIHQLRKANKHYDKFSIVFENEQDEIAKLEDELRKELRDRFRITGIV